MSKKPTDDIEPGRYVDFQRSPITGNRLSKLAHNWGAVATIVLATGSSLQGRALDTTLVSTLCSTVLLMYCRRVDKIVSDHMFPGQVIDTRPDPTTPKNELDANKLQALHKGFYGKFDTVCMGLSTVELCAHFALLTHSNFLLLGAAGGSFQNKYITHKVKTGEWVIIPKDQMKKKEEARQLNPLVPAAA